MNKKINHILALTAIYFAVIFSACSPPSGNATGSEYMPDMGHSLAYEANYYDYYYYNTWGTEEDYHKFAQPRVPVKGTIPRGMAGTTTAHDSGRGISVPINGSVPYYYEDTEEERTRAMNEIINNPYPITTAGLARAKDLYNVNCAICHGEKGDGDGFLVAEANVNAKYPAQPAILISEEFRNASNGRFYHAIMHGKNVMGGYADKLSYEERWQVIHYIRSLQAKEAKKEYSEAKNTLNAIDVPGSTIVKTHIAQNIEMEKGVEEHGNQEEHSMEEDHDHKDDSHEEHEH